MGKVQQNADHVSMILRHIPYVLTNFVLGLDADEGPEPFELAKRFVDQIPAAFPGFSLLTPLVQHEHVVEAFAADTASESLFGTVCRGSRLDCIGDTG